MKGRKKEIKKERKIDGYIDRHSCIDRLIYEYKEDKYIGR